MTLIIAARCIDGCVVVSDTRQHKVNNGIKSIEDGYNKAIISGSYIVYNHGYNLIDNKDWKLIINELTPDINNPIYKRIQQEMIYKDSKKAFYVFINRNIFHEISIDAEGSIILETENNNELHKSGTGKPYVNFSSLKNIKQKCVQIVKNEMVTVFNKAFDKLLANNGNEFSKEYEITILKRANKRV